MMASLATGFSSASAILYYVYYKIYVGFLNQRGTGRFDLIAMD